MSRFMRFYLSFAASKLHLSCVVLYCHLCLAPLYHIFPHSFINGTIFGKKVTEHKMLVLILSTILAKTLLILRRIQGDIIINMDTCLCEVSDILVRA